MTENPYPKRCFKATGDTFICPSEEFMNGIKDKDLWKDTPWTPEELNPKCKDCKNLKEMVILLEEEIALHKEEIKRLNKRPPKKMIVNKRKAKSSNTNIKESPCQTPQQTQAHQAS